ncbi:MAG: 23S rRNA methyltransferase [Immundisolibacteraceae bacterium]|nr:23S rRNA methyltransferase [Immundisolibacteraceae bacterium]
MVKKTASSRRWLDRHVSDEWVQQAQQDGYRSRASYKLLGIDQRDKLFSRHATVIDLGAAPGGWSQVARRALDDKSRVIALDILEMEPLPGVEFIQGDFRQQVVLDQLIALLGNQKVDLVISDMAPNISGIKAVDQPALINLLELALELSELVLKPNGKMLVKVFEGSGLAEFRQRVKACFNKVVMRKPAASRNSSAEQFLLATGFQG